MRLKINSQVAAYRAIYLLFVLLASVCLALSPEKGWSRGYQEADLSLNINHQGKALVGLHLRLASPPEEQFNPDILTQTVSKAVGCKLENVRVNGSKTWWFVMAKCDRSFMRSGWFVKAEVNPAPLVEVLRPLNVKAIAIYIRHPRTGSSNSSVSDGSESSSNEVFHSYTIPVGTVTPQPLSIEFGYRTSDVLLIFAPLAVVVLLPLGLTCWMRQAALRAQKTDPAAVWFSYLRFLNWVVLGTWLVWFSIRFTSSQQEFINFALWGESVWQKVAVEVSLSFLPPAVAIVLCYAISHPVFTKVRGMEWTRDDLMRQAAWSQCATYLPLILVIIGINAFREDLRLGVVLFAAAFASRVLFARLLMKAQDLTLHAITVGELRDRIFALASQAGVQLQQVYILPAGKGQLANAFASSGNIIMLSDYLLKQMSKREVDAIVAHELGHLKHKHPETLGRILILAIFLLVLLASILNLFLPWMPWPIVSGLLVAPVVYIFSRRFEYAADAEAVALSGDAEACITSLSKITRLNLMPLQWGKLNEKMLTHPSTLRRVEAIAQHGGISSQQLQHILATPSTNIEHYALLPSVISEKKVFSTTFKADIIFRIAWAQIAVKTITPALYVLVVKFVLPAQANWAIYLGGFALAIALSLAVTNFMSMWGYDELQRRLRVKLEREGIRPDQLRGIFVGFAPDASSRIYENFFDWDVGFLFVTKNCIRYVGEQTRFALQQKQVTDVHLGAGSPGWLSAPRIYITWHDEERNTTGIFNLHPVGVRSLLQHKREVRVLNQQLQAWYSLSSPTVSKPIGVSQVTIPSPLVELNTPDIGTVTSISPRDAVKFRQLIASIYLLSLVAVGVSVLLQLPFIASLYVIVVACITTTFQFVPYWRDRNPKSAGGR